MILRIAREKVGHRQGLMQQNKRPISNELGRLHLQNPSRGVTSHGLVGATFPLRPARHPRLTEAPKLASRSHARRTGVSFADCRLSSLVNADCSLTCSLSVRALRAGTR